MTNEKPVKESEVPGAEAAAKEYFVKEYKGSLEQYAIDNFLAGASWAVGEKWISVDDRLPERNGRWLLVYEAEYEHQTTLKMVGGRIEIGYLDTVMPESSVMSLKPLFCLSSGQFTPFVTHWMPLPTPPINNANQIKE